jgi:hypothetical protein
MVVKQELLAGLPDGLMFKDAPTAQRGTWNALPREGFDPGGKHHNENHRARRES